MKNLNLLILLLAITMVGCKTQKIAPKPQPVAEETTVTPAPAPTAPKSAKPVSVASRTEKFSVAEGETADFGSNRYFVIMGSFKAIENAKRLKETLVNEGFHPVILVNESGMFRVCGNSYAEESAARTRIADVRGKYTKYSDIWLLIKPQ